MESFNYNDGAGGDITVELLPNASIRIGIEDEEHFVYIDLPPVEIDKLLITLLGREVK